MCNTIKVNNTNVKTLSGLSPYLLGFWALTIHPGAFYMSLKCDCDHPSMDMFLLPSLKILLPVTSIKETEDSVQYELLTSHEITKKIPKTHKSSWVSEYYSGIINTTEVTALFLPYLIFLRSLVCICRTRKTFHIFLSNKWSTVDVRENKCCQVYSTMN